MWVVKALCPYIHLTRVKRFFSCSLRFFIEAFRYFYAFWIDLSELLSIDVWLLNRDVCSCKLILRVSRIASTVQSACTCIPDNNLTKHEQHALKRLKNDKDIVIPPADKGQVTVVMDKTGYLDKMEDPFVNDSQTYRELKHDLTLAQLH